MGARTCFICYRTGSIGFELFGWDDVYESDRIVGATPIFRCVEWSECQGRRRRVVE